MANHHLSLNLVYDIFTKTVLCTVYIFFYLQTRHSTNEKNAELKFLCINCTLTRKVKLETLKTDFTKPC